MGAEIRQNLSHFPYQPLPPLGPLSLFALQLWKLPPGAQTPTQHPSEVKADGGTDGKRTNEQ